MEEDRISRNWSQTMPFKLLPINTVFIFDFWTITNSLALVLSNPDLLKGCTLNNSLNYRPVQSNPLCRGLENAQPN